LQINGHSHDVMTTATVLSRPERRPRWTPDKAHHTVAMQSISTSNGPCHAETQMKLRAGGSDVSGLLTARL
jgi:hypothetical protein